MSVRRFGQRSGLERLMDGMEQHPVAYMIAVTVINGVFWLAMLAGALLLVKAIFF